MRKILISLALVLIFGGPIIGYFCLRSEISKSNLLGIGEEAFYFQLRTTDGKDFNLADYNGKKTLLVFFKSDCSPCLMQLANLNKIKEKVQEKLEIIAVSESDEEKTREFERTYNLNFPVLVDDKKVYKSKYGSSGFPTFYLLDEEMKVRYRRIGYRSLDLDEKIISEFIKKDKIPIEIYSDSQKENFVIDNFRTSISAFGAREIALKDPEVAIFIRENFIYPEKRVEIINLRWIAKEQMYRWIIQIIDPPCDCPEKENTLNIVRIELDPISQAIITRELIKELPEGLYKERLYQEVTGYSSLINKQK